MILGLRPPPQGSRPRVRGFFPVTGRTRVRKLSEYPSHRGPRVFLRSVPLTTIPMTGDDGPTSRNDSSDPSTVAVILGQGRGWWTEGPREATRTGTVLVGPTATVPPFEQFRIKVVDWHCLSFDSLLLVSWSYIPLGKHRCIDIQGFLEILH